MKDMNDNGVQNQVQAEEIDLMELAKKLWSARQLIIKACAWAALAGLVIGFSIPKEYTTTVKLSPEITNSRSDSSLNSLAALAGISTVSQGADAVFPELYPDVVASTPFLTDMFDIQVEEIGGKMSTTLYDYMLNHQRSAWWSTVASLPFKFLGWVKDLFAGTAQEDHTLDPAHLTPSESAVVKALSHRIGVAVDKKTSIVTISVTMQDPMISAAVTDAVMRNLQRYITDYRTNKSRNDLEFTQKLYDESKQQYYDAQQAYASYVDQNQNIVRHSVRTEQERLQNEMDLAYSLYNQMSAQLQMAKAKVQESTPVYAVVQPATVPLKASKPSKTMILAACIFLAAVGACAWVLFGKETLERFRAEE